MKADDTRDRVDELQIIREQREANEQLVLATIRADEAVEAAEAARAAAEAAAHELRAMAEFRETFIGVLGHDLRNPLAAIVMLATTLLARGRLDEEDAKLVERIVTSGKRMNRMIEQILGFTRARLGSGLPLERKPTDLRAVCREVVEELELGATVHLAEAEGDVTGDWDPDRLAEVLSNLVCNAIEHADPDTAVEIQARADGADGVAVAVSNHGAPIPPDVLPVMFEPFRGTARRPRKQSKPGNLGLGLYIANQIVRAHGGTLTASHADRTTTFTMRLPRVAPAPRRDE